MDERTIGSGRQEALGDVTMLSAPALSRSRGISLLAAGPGSWSAGAWTRPRRSLAGARSGTALRQSGVFVRTVTLKGGNHDVEQVFGWR